MKVTSSDGICTASLPLSQFSFECETPPVRYLRNDFTKQPSYTLRIARRRLAFVRNFCFQILYQITIQRSCCSIGYIAIHYDDEKAKNVLTRGNNSLIKFFG